MRRILVTGANKGIGLAIVEAILDRHGDTFVFLGARSLQRGEAARDQLVAAHPEWSERVKVLELDVASDASVQAAAKEVAAMFPEEPTPLYGLVNNAGIGLAGHGLEEVLEVNTLGVRRTCEAFLPLLPRGPSPQRGRVVNITSASGPNYVSGCSPARQAFFVDPKVEWAQLQDLINECLAMAGDDAAFAAAGLGSSNPYGLSKACANTYTLLLARQNPDLHINACTPGYIETDLTRPVAEARGKNPSELGMKPPAEGTRAPMHLLFGALEGNGRYYGSDAQRSPLDRYRSPGDPPYRGP